jgi:phosphate transport system protein
MENEVNTYHTRLDDLCLKYIALKRPMAKDLRIAISIIKMNSDLERMADLALNIKVSHSHLKEMDPAMKRMHNEVQLMLKNAIDSFVQGSQEKAAEVIEHDKIVDDLNRSNIRFYTEKKVVDFESAYFSVIISNKFERIGDHSTNIAEDVIFIESAKDVRHKIEKEKGKT